jgi:two-component system phosphate regulon sensor histidine kinase PhoR
MFRRLRWRIALPYVTLVLVATLGLTVYVSNQVRLVRLADLEAQLLADARLLASSVAPLIQDGTNPGTLDELARRWAAPLAGRVTIIGADGIALGESHVDRTEMDNHLLRPEVQQALNTGQGSSRRYSATVGYEMMYAAVPIQTGGGRLLGVMRVALPLSQIEDYIGRLRQTIVLAGLVTVLLAALLAVFLVERTTQPVRRLTDAAERMAKGDLSAYPLPSTRDEVGELTRAFNDMAGQMREQATSLAAVLDHMTEGVLITDGSGQVRLVNAAAARLLDTAEKRALGRSFAQVAPFHPLIELWKECREKGEEQVGMVEISRHGLVLQAHITPFPEAGAGGYLVILQDLTRIRRLEMVRREFVSGISQELRTPLAGLKTMVNTLHGGALQDTPAAKRFLQRLDAEVDALTHVAEDLQELSRIESGQVPLRLAPASVAEVVALPVDRLRPQAEWAGLELTLLLPPELPQVLADADRARLALTNLVHNAVKSTPPGGRITVAAQPAGDEVVFSVQDSGVGIPVEDLPRIFERFYAVDGGRSGGTGLGLTVAKHIVEGHGGRIWAESIEGQGSTFYFTLPVAQSPFPALVSYETGLGKNPEY